MTTAPFERSDPVPGVRLVTERMPHVRSVAIGVWVDVGSRDEPDDLGGASHLLEHLLFKGTARRTALEISQQFDAIGGELDAYSAKEHTCYYARVLDADVALAVDVIADMISNALLRAEDLEAERKVVLEEIHMTFDNPGDLVHDVFCERAYAGHPLGRPVLGTEESVSGIDRDRLASYFRGAYGPGRLVVAAAGNLDHASVEAFVRDGLGALAPAISRAGQPASAPAFGRSAFYDQRSTEQAHIVWGGRGIARQDDDRYVLPVLNTLFGGGMSSRLFQEVRERRGLVYSIFSYHHAFAESGLFGVYAGTSETSAPQVLEIVREQAALIAGGAADPEEVERAKGHVKGSLVLSMDDPGGRMSRLGRSELQDGEVLIVDELLDLVDAVTQEQVTQLARRLFVDTELALVCVGPVAEGTLDPYVEPLT